MSVLLKKSGLFTEYSDIKDICKPLEQKGIIGFIYMRHFPDGSFIDFSNQLPWSQYFLERYYSNQYDTDAINDHMFISDGVSLWVLNQDNVLWQEGEKYFGFGNGVSIYFNREKYTDVFCFYGKSTDHHLNQLYINHIDELKQFCQYFLFKAMPIIKRNKENRLQTPDKYTRKDSRCDKFDLSKKIINMPGHATSGIRLRNKNSLSERELLCVQLSAQGYTAQQIANDAALSRRTVETYINNAKNKFGCNNLCELVYYCVKNAIIV